MVFYGWHFDELPAGLGPVIGYFEGWYANGKKRKEYALAWYDPSGGWGSRIFRKNADISLVCWAYILQLDSITKAKARAREHLKKMSKSRNRQDPSSLKDENREDPQDRRDAGPARRSAPVRQGLPDTSLPERVERWNASEWHCTEVRERS